MTQQRDWSGVAKSVTHDELETVLLDLTGDLSKARVLHQTLPHWLVKAKPETSRALEQAHIDSEALRKRAKERLARLRPLDRFCVEQLKFFLEGKGINTLDVERDVLELPKRELSGVLPSLGGQLIKTVTVTRHTLVQAAMQNFTQAQADGALPVDAVIRLASSKQVAPSLSAEAFVGYCRELDLGATYQKHIIDILGLPPSATVSEGELSYNPAVADIGQSRCLDMQTDLHIALAKGDIRETTHARILALIKADRPVLELGYLSPGGKPMIWQGLNIGGACLWGVLVFCEAASGSLAAGGFAIYMPNEPVRPWFEYRSLDDFKAYLSLKLQVPSYRTFFNGYLDESERVDFYAEFDKNRTLGRLEAVVSSHSLSAFFFGACVGKLQFDALALAVPVAQVDEDAREKRLQGYLDAALDVLNVAAFVVPVLGQLMMGVAIGQLLGEVFDGVEDWAHGDQTAALRHLINVAESIATMALFAAGGRVVGSLKRKLTGSTQFFDTMEAVTPANGQSKLWRPRLSAYRQALVLDEQAVLSAQGVYQVNGQSYIKMDGDLYAIDYDADIDQWRINHPRRPDAYRPPLVHNNEGGWQHVFERPERWHDPVYHLSRLDPSLAVLPHEHLESLASIVGLSREQLARLNLEHEALPARFQDCVARFRQLRKIHDLKYFLERDMRPHVRTARTQLLALPLLSGWPKGRFFEVLDARGDLVERYPEVAPFDYEDLSIHITQEQLKAGEVMSTLLKALDGEERSQLLGKGEHSEKVLSKRLLNAIKQHQQTLHEQLYRDYDGVATHELVAMRTRFPQLPARIGQELLNQASSAQRLHVRNTKRLPLSLAQKAREAAVVIEEDNALLGLYLPALANDATRRVAVGMLGHLPDWPKDLLLQVRDQTLLGTVVNEVGPATAATKCTVLQTAAGFQAVNDIGLPLGDVSAEPEGFYQAVVDALPAVRRTDMGVDAPSGAAMLRHKIQMAVQKNRRRVSGYLWPERGMPEEPTACIQAQMLPVEAPPPALARKVRKLYPLLTDREVSAFIQQAGTDHLSRARAVEALEQEYQLLHRALKAWRNDISGYTAEDGSLWDFRLSRTQTANALEHCWRRMIRVPGRDGVKVPGVSLGDLLRGRLPTLPPQVSFEHVQSLSLANLKLNDDVGYFLKHFKGLHSLDLAGNQLTRLPAVLSQMPELEHLVLANNKLQLNQYDRGRLVNMQDLQTLNLSENPLVDPPDVRRMFGLRELILRDCQLKAFPNGLLRLPHLDLVDLRQNDILTLPDGLFALPLRLAETFNLRHNPLDVPTRQALEDLRTRIGTGMGFMEDDIPRLNEQRAREIWLPDDGVDGFADKDVLWAGLKDEPASDSLFQLLVNLGGTADAAHVREDLDRRVWRVLEAAADDAELRSEIFERTATPFNCDDAVADSFSQLEVLLELRDIAKRVERGEATGTSLLDLGRRLFRLDHLETLARQYSLEHPGTDALEVGLAYRTGLADTLNLPGQPKHMRYGRLAGVTEKALAQAQAQLQAAELSPQLMQYLSRLPFWVSYLKRTAGSRFAALNEPFDQRMAQVFEHAETLSDARYREQMDAILREQKLAEGAEIVRQTDQALKTSELSGCRLR